MKGKCRNRIRSATMRLKSPELQSWSFILLVALSVLGLTTWRIEEAREVQIEEGKVTTANLARSIADQAHATVHAAETIVSGVARATGE